jgi:type VI protein secretion system component Hcp
MSKVASLFLNLTSGPEGPGEKRILGEAKDALYKDQIEINGWSWDLSRSSESSALTKIGSSIPPPPNSVVPSALKFTKTMCRATSGMLHAMCDGSLLTAVFSLEEDSDVDFLLRVTLKRVRIVEYELSIDGPDVSETWKVDYGSIRFDYDSAYMKDGERTLTRRGAVTVKLTRHAGASNKDPASLSSGSNEEKILALAEKMPQKGLEPLARKLEKMSMSSPGIGKTDKATKVTKG